MRPRAILREAWRDVTTGTTRTVTLALLLTVVSVGLSAVDLMTVRTITDAASAYQDSGASVITLTAPGRIDGAACEALAGVPNVRAAGAIRTTGAGIAAAVLPSSPIPVMDVTTGFPRVLRAESAVSAGVTLSDQAATAIAVATGDDLVTRSGSTTVAGVYAYPVDGRRAGYGYAALVPVPAHDVFDECWVDIWPASAQTPTLLRTTVLPADGSTDQPVLAQLNSTLGARFDGSASFEARVTRHSAGLALALGVGLGYVAVRTRRIQLASALHAGVSKGDLAATTAVQTASWTLPAALVTAATIAVFVATGPADDALVTILLGARIGLLAGAGVFVGSAVALALTRERHLFRYFKDR